MEFYSECQTWDNFSGTTYTVENEYEIWVMSLYTTGLLKAMARKLAMYKLDLVEVQEFIWGKEGNEEVDDNTFLHWKRVC